MAEERKYNIGEEYEEEYYFALFTAFMLIDISVGFTCNGILQ